MSFYTCESDFIVGKVGKLRRYLVCSMEGYFPVLVRTGENSLAVIFRTGGPHIGLSATLAVARSDDGGRSWGDPVEITPRWSDARNPAFGVNGEGRLIAAYWKAKNSYDPEKAKNGAARFEGDTGLPSAGCFYQFSRDGGRTWDGERPLVLDAPELSLCCPYGRIVADKDGTLYMNVYGAVKGGADRSYILRSRNGGDSWGDATLFGEGYNETAFCFLRDGSMVAAARDIDGAVQIAKSTDRGRSWGEIKRVTRAGEHPADLCELSGGELLMTYGRRIRPMGCGGLVSRDGGETWDYLREIILAGDGGGGDLGYPSTVRLGDGSLNTALYYANGSEPEHACWGAVSCQMIKYEERDIL